MNFRTTVVAFTLGLMALLSFMPGEVRASNIETKLQQSFDAMVNHTPPSVHMGSRRGMISGGSLSIRTPVNTIKPFSFQAPTWSFGCGGIDIYGGAFSFISKEQLVQIMRSIVTAAITYAFKLALTSMCPKCENMMSDLQSRLQSWTEFLTNTCEATRNFMDEKGIRGRISNWAEQYQLNWGTEEDSSKAKRYGAPTTSTLKGLENHPQIYKGMNAYGNQIWNMFEKAGESSFGFGNKQFYEEMISVSGTVIACMPEDEGCIKRAKNSNGIEQQADGQKGQVVTFVLPSIMGVKELVEGGKSVVRYVCKSSSEGCMDMEVQKSNIIGLESRIRSVFNGEGSNPGLLSRVRIDPLYEPSQEELKWLRLGGSTAGMAIKLAMNNLTTAKGFIDDNAKSLAAAIITEMLELQLNSARQAASKTDQEAMDTSISLLQEASDRSRDQMRTYAADASLRSNQYVGQKALLDLQSQ